MRLEDTVQLIPLYPRFSILPSVLLFYWTYSENKRLISRKHQYKALVLCSRKCNVLLYFGGWILFLPLKCKLALQDFSDFFNLLCCRDIFNCASVLTWILSLGVFSWNMKDTVLCGWHPSRLVGFWQWKLWLTQEGKWHKGPAEDSVVEDVERSIFCSNT